MLLVQQRSRLFSACTAFQDVARRGCWRNFSITTRWFASAHVTWPPYLVATNQDFGNAISDSETTYTYSQLIRRSVVLSSRLQRKYGPKTFHGQQVATLLPNNAALTVSQWATWQLGGTSVPLALKHPQELLEYKIKHSMSNIVLVMPEDEALASKLCESLHDQGHSLSYYTINMLKLQNPHGNDVILDDWNHAKPTDSNALMIYTSGTTGKPKGVVWSHGALANQCKSMAQLWGWQRQDVCLNVLPLYHIHGLMNALYVPLSVGAHIRLPHSFVPGDVWKMLIGETASASKNLVFTAVPAMYNRMLDHWRENLDVMSGAHLIRQEAKKRVKLAMCGSAPLTEQTFARWKNLTDLTLLERYGMSEVGMVLSNPLEPITGRHPGFVGQPMPGIAIRICEEETTAKDGDEQIGATLLEWHHGYKPKLFREASNDAVVSGSLLIKSNSMFKEYWQNDAATRESFTDDGFFITGDVAMYDRDKNSIKLLGRSSADIMKVSGYKLSALEVEQALASCELVNDITVFSLPDDATGEKVVALVAVNQQCAAKAGISPEDSAKLLAALNNYAARSLPKYSLLKDVIVVDQVPKNFIGKVNKKELKARYSKK